MDAVTDPIAALLPMVHGDVPRWELVCREIARRTEAMGNDHAIASVRADLEAGRL